MLQVDRLTENQEMQLQVVTEQKQVWLEAQEVAEWVCREEGESEVTNATVSKARFIFAKTSNSVFELGVKVAKWVNLTCMLNECGMNDGVFFRRASAEASELWNSLKD